MRRLRFAGFVTKSTLLTLTASAALLLPGTAMAQAKHYPLGSTAGLRLLNVSAEPATLQGKKGLRVTMSEEAMGRLQRMTPEERERLTPQQRALAEPLAVAL